MLCEAAEGHQVQHDEGQVQHDEGQVQHDRMGCHVGVFPGWHPVFFIEKSEFFEIFYFPIEYNDVFYYIISIIENGFSPFFFFNLNFF